MTEKVRMHEGRVILVTGASRGIGESVARCLASESATVLLVARSSIELERVAREIVADGGLAVPMTADIGEMGDIDRIVHRVRAIRWPGELRRRAPFSPSNRKSK